MMNYDILANFAQWWVANRVLKPPADNFISKVGKCTGMTLFREAPFQVQLFLTEPDYDIVDHIHPNIDSYEVYLAGEVFFRLNGEILVTAEMCKTAPESLIGKMIRILPTDWHGATTGPAGGAFFSVQHWLNGVPPSSVELDWGGPGLDPQHDQALNR